jgi:hypothetical protein
MDVLTASEERDKRASLGSRSDPTRVVRHPFGLKNAKLLIGVDLGICLSGAAAGTRRWQ